MTVLGTRNSRMKDFFDVAYLIDHVALDPQTLTEAIRATFTRRITPLPTELPVALTEEFCTNGPIKARWQAFVKRNRIAAPLDDLPTVIDKIAHLVLPIFTASGISEREGEIPPA